MSIAPRDICSRMNTFMLETTKPASREDKESLVVERVSKWVCLKSFVSKSNLLSQGENQAQAPLVCRLKSGEAHVEWYAFQVVIHYYMLFPGYHILLLSFIKEKGSLKIEVWNPVDPPPSPLCETFFIRNNLFFSSNDGFSYSLWLLSFNILLIFKLNIKGSNF